ncbi:MAG: hypothetical protein IJK84_10230 [Bacteroidales bacterium]|nr:hypothetical protein [Bacteroidales bacterium]MBQ9587088.1 hypothetical protein [Bacteroidales bacterium]
MQHHIIKSLAILASDAMLLTGCSTKHKAVVEEAYIFVPTLNMGGGMTPTETEVSRMPDSLFDGRPYIIADSSLYALSARQISLLRTFDNPNAGQIIKLIESIDDVLRQSGNTITTREALMSYYHNFDLLDQMTD